MMKINRTITHCIVLSAAALLLLGGCRGSKSEQPPVHPNPNMDTQAKYTAQRSSDWFVDGAAMRTPPAGTVARGHLREDAVWFTGKNGDGSYAAAIPFVVEAADLARGAERFTIYCQPCHGAGGDGKGKIMEYKYPIPPTSFHEQRVIDMADGSIYEVISNGIRNMPSYRQQIPVRDRWCIVAHVRQLQQQGPPPATQPAAAAQQTTETSTNETAQ